MPGVQRRYSAARSSAAQQAARAWSLDPPGGPPPPAAGPPPPAAARGSALGHLDLDLPPAQRLGPRRPPGRRSGAARSPGRRRPPRRRGLVAGESHHRPFRVELAIGASGRPPVTSATRDGELARAPAVGGVAERLVHLLAGAVGGGQLEVPALVGSAGAPAQRDLARREPVVGGVEVGGGQVVQRPARPPSRPAARRSRAARSPRRRRTSARSPGAPSSSPPPVPL